MANLLFYDDSPVFGGHEVMSLLGLEAILSRSENPVHFLATGANAKLLDRLAAIGNTHPQLLVETLPWHSSKLEAARNLFLPSRTRVLADRFTASKPDLVIAIQGNIEHSSLSLRAARRAKIRATSYIPVPHSNAEMGARFGAARDLFCRSLFSLPDAFITITDEMASLLKKRGATCPIHVVYNGIDTGRFAPADRVAARASLDLPSEPTVIGMIGRLEFRQKQQHLLVEAVASDPFLSRSCHLVFAGEGPDENHLRDLLQRHQLSSTLLPWCDPAGLYPALDALVIPSRYEGLPLVMLEALSSGTAVLGSDRDGMKDLLPPHWRFRPGDPVSLSSTLKAFVQGGNPTPSSALVFRVREEMSLDAFAEAFASTVFSLASPSSTP